MMTLEIFYYGVYQFNFLLNLMHLNKQAQRKNNNSNNKTEKSEANP